jgi:peptidase E
MEEPMICFLTSSTGLPESNTLNPANQFIEELRQHIPNHCRALFVCSDPNQYEVTDFYASAMKMSFEDAGFQFAQFNVLDNRNENLTINLINDSDLIILAGGHVPTQNLFFHKIGLKDILKGYSGIIIGISAGSMNSADLVYAQPELEGEALDPTYQRFLKGLGLTKTMLLPHYETVKNDILDGLRAIEDIAFEDSIGKTFYAIPDGSYLFIMSGKEELRGEAHMIKDGVITQISNHNEVVSL